MSRTSRALTNTDLAFLLCTTATTLSPTKGKASQRNFCLSFETDYGLVLSLEPDGSITISLRKPPAPVPKKEYSDLDPLDSATPIQSQQLFAFPSVSPAPISHGSIDGVLSSPVSLGFGTGMGGASITPARSTPSRSMSGVSTPGLTRTSSQNQSRNQTQQRNMTTSKSHSNSPNMKIKYYIRPGLDANCSSHMYYTASASTSPQPQPPTNGNTKPRLHRVKLSHLQSLYHTPSNSRSNSWFDAYLDWIDRLEDALSRQNDPQTPITALPLSPIRGAQTKEVGPFKDSGEKSLWLVEGLLLASWLSLQEGVEGVEYLPLPEHESEVYRLEGGMGSSLKLELESGVEGERKGKGNNAGVMMKRLLEVIRAGAGE